MNTEVAVVQADTERVLAEVEPIPEAVEQETIAVVDSVITVAEAALEETTEPVEVLAIIETTGISKNAIDSITD